MDFCRNTFKRKGSDFLLIFLYDIYSKASNTSLKCPLMPQTYYFKNVYFDPNKLPGFLFLSSGEIKWNVVFYTTNVKSKKLEKLTHLHGKLKYGNK